MGKYPKSLCSTKLKKSTSRGRGRPRKIKLLPKNPEIAQIRKEKERHLEKDELLQKLANNPNSLDVLDLLMFELAKEASSLHFERGEAERKGADTSVLSSKKVTALKSVADIYFRKRDAVLDQAFDFKSKRFEKFIEWMLMKVVMKAAQKAGMSSEQISIMFDQIAQKFEEDKWDEEAMSYVKSD